MKVWDEAAPDLARYPYQPSIKPHPFMGLDRFSASGLHQMRSVKGYLRAHPSWDSDLPTTCPSCQSAPETFEHAILHSSAKEPCRNRHLQGVFDIGPDAPFGLRPRFCAPSPAALSLRLQPSPRACSHAQHPLLALFLPALLM